MLCYNLHKVAIELIIRLDYATEMLNPIKNLTNQSIFFLSVRCILF